MLIHTNAVILFRPKAAPTVYRINLKPTLTVVAGTAEVSALAVQITAPADQTATAKAVYVLPLQQTPFRIHPQAANV
jgi:hypothetical protein